MVTLADKTIRDGLGIDTFDRAILYSAFLLRFVYSQDAALLDKIKILPSVTYVKDVVNNIIKPKLIISVQATLSIAENALTSGGDVLNNIIPIIGNASYNGEPLYPSNTAFSFNPNPNIIAPIEDDIPNLDSLEKYFYWSLLSYQLYYLGYSTIDSNLNDFAVNILPLYKGNNSQYNLSISANIAGFYDLLLTTGSLLNCVLGSPLNL